MGNSASLLDVSNTFRSFCAPNAPTADRIDGLLALTMRRAEMEQVLSLEVMRELRHLYTGNFALVLHHVIKEIASMAARAARANTAGVFLSDSVPAESTRRFLAALGLLRRLLPVALEDGRTPIRTDNSTPSTTHQKASAAASSQKHGAPSIPRESAPLPVEKGDDVSVEMAPRDPPASAAAESSPNGTVPSTAAPATTEVVVPEATRPAKAAGPKRTAATEDFAVRFFMRGSTCRDAAPEERFPLLPGQKRAAANVRDGDAGTEEVLPLGAFLVRCLVECCFIRGLTLDPKVTFSASPEPSRTHPEVMESFLWQPGVGSADPNARATQKPVQAVSEARTAVLGTLLSVLSNALYHPADYRDSIFMEPLISTTQVPLTPTLVLSMLNTVMNYVPYGMLPYTSHFTGSEEGVVLASAKTLCAMLSYRGIPLTPAGSNSAANVLDANGSTGSSSKVPQAPQERQPTRQPSREGDENESASNLFPPSGEDEEEGVQAHKEGSSQHQNLRDDGHHGNGDIAATLDYRDDAQKSKERERADKGDGSCGHHPPKGASVSGAPSRQHTGSPSPSPAAQVPPQLVHSARKTIHDISLTEAKLLVERLSTLIGVRAYSQSTIFPESQRSFPSEYQFMILLLRLLDLSPSVETQFTVNPAVLTYLVPIMNSAMDARTNPSNVDSLHIALSILTRLSEARSFVLLCNQPFTGFIPFLFPRQSVSSNSPVRPASFNDFLIIALCQLLETPQLALCPQLGTCSTVMANLAPYITELCPSASARLVSVFVLYAHRTLKAQLPSASGGSNSVGSDQGSRIVSVRGSSASLSDAQQHHASPAGSTSAGGERAGLSPNTNATLVRPASSGPTITHHQALEKLGLQQFILVNVTETIASLLQYHENGSRYLLASLVDHATIIRKTKDAYLVQKTRQLVYKSPVPFLVDCLDAAVALARPLVESANALSLSMEQQPKGKRTASAGDSVSRIGEIVTVGGNHEDGESTTATTATSSSSSPQGAKTGTKAPGGSSVLAALLSAPPPVFSSVADNPVVMEKLKSLTLVGALPTPHPITTRRLQVTRHYELWAICSFWNSTYTQTPGGWMGDASSVKLLRFA